MGLAAILAVLVVGPVVAQTTPPMAVAQPQSDYSVKPSDVALSKGVEFGQYRRFIQPYENWVLNCDENLKTKQRICNVSQIIIDAQGATVFSWSLAATKDGKPMMILRVPPAAGQDGTVNLTFPGRKQPVMVKTSQCDDTVCLGLVPVGAIFREHINKMSTVGVSFDFDPLGKISLNAPLKGLSQALSDIK